MLHLGDFIYEVVEYPDEVAHRYDRTVFDIGRIPHGRKVGNFHVPTTLDGYRMVYRAHIADSDIQEACAWFPFVCIGENHEFSWQGWQSTIKYNGKAEPARPLRVAKAAGPGSIASHRPIWSAVPVQRPELKIPAKRVASACKMVADRASGERRPDSTERCND